MDEPHTIKKCYLCGSIHNLTRDHIPPKGFFRPPLPTNLITVPCCRSCNEAHSLDDEAFRAFASALMGRSKQGKWIWTNRVVGSSFQRSKKFKQNFAASLIPTEIKGTAGLIKTHMTLFEEERGNRFLKRITKGLIKHFHPEVDYTSAYYDVGKFDPTPELVESLMKVLLYDERGTSTFRFWRSILNASKPDSIWVYLFYDAAMFAVGVNLKLDIEKP